tara:strand:- start:15258 stop:15458 length:201 start_codon:yes stop_codon:yes gene_type:complete
MKVMLKNSNNFLAVLTIIDLWHVHSEWWRKNLGIVSRMYYKLNVDERIIIVFKDLNSNEWFVQNDL